MKEDPIISEIRRWRVEYAARFNHDLDAIVRDLKEGERGKNTVRLPAKAAEVAPKTASPSGSVAVHQS